MNKACVLIEELTGSLVNVYGALWMQMLNRLMSVR